MVTKSQKASKRRCAQGLKRKKKLTRLYYYYLQYIVYMPFISSYTLFHCLNKVLIRWVFFIIFVLAKFSFMKGDSLLYKRENSGQTGKRIVINKHVIISLFTVFVRFIVISVFFSFFYTKYYYKNI